jgi:hypothetical protein
MLAVLYYGTLPLSMIAYGDLSRHPVNFQLERWHAERCEGIISRILEDPEFAQRVRTLKVYASGQRDEMSSQMSQPRLSIDPNVSLMLHSLPLPRSSKADKVGTVCMSWDTLCLDQNCRCFTYGCPTAEGSGHQVRLGIDCTRIHSILIVSSIGTPKVTILACWRNLESLCIDPLTNLTFCTYKNCFKQALCLKNLRIANMRDVSPLITPLVGKLTHLEPRHNFRSAMLK